MIYRTVIFVLSLSSAREIYADSECKPLSSDKIPQKTGQKAWDKCIDYYAQIVNSCGQEQEAISCNDPLPQSAGVATIEGPHMASVGYVKDGQSARWVCGGNIISDHFVLTAAVCGGDVFKKPDEVTFVRVGTTNTSEPLDISKIYKVKRIIQHPEFKPPRKYNDIALFETEQPIKLDPFVRPCCLDVGNFEFGDKADVVGWRHPPSEDRADNEILQKRTFSKYTTDECAHLLRPYRHLEDGINGTTMLCYGDKSDNTDNCLGTSGSPVQVKNAKLDCMFTVIGLTSFGKRCTTPIPVVYTAVAPYVPWIESVVWP